MNLPLKILADKNMPLAQEAFSTLGQVTIVDGRTLQPQDMIGTDLLAIRSTTKVNEHLLQHHQPKFIGTATIGTDHLDIPLLEQLGIHWEHAPGCNARSVSEYITAALLTIDKNTPIEGKTLGIIGVGNVGTQIIRVAKALGMQLCLCDPPRKANGPELPDGLSFCSLDTLLAQSDIITIHVPLTRDGSCPTFHLFDHPTFHAMPPGRWLINASRGSVVATQPLKEALISKHLAGAILDTWENEPDIDPELMQLTTIATPHIAGHSYEGKANGTLMIYQSACRYFKAEPRFDPAPFMPQPQTPEVDCRMLPPDQARIPILRQVIPAVYNLAADDQRLRNNPTITLKENFEQLRKNYPIRREFTETTVRLPAHAPERWQQSLMTLGFKIS